MSAVPQQVSTDWKSIALAFLGTLCALIAASLFLAGLVLSKPICIVLSLTILASLVLVLREPELDISDITR